MTQRTDTQQRAAVDEQRLRHPLARGIELLTLMVDSHQSSYGVRELAGQLGVSPSTVHRLVTDLERIGLVRRSTNGSYQLGLEFLRLAWTTTARFPLHEVASDTLHELAKESGESSFFGVYGGQRREMMFTLTVESPHPLRYTLPEGVWLPLHAGASGLAILAFLREDVRDEIARGTLDPATSRTLVDAEALLARLEKIREEGYAITHGERIEGAIAIAAPVFGSLGDVVGATGITVPETRFNAAQASSLAAMVRRAAGQLTGYISGSGRTRSALAR
ncbi:IclR family transcriptional regulator [Paenarthrobacter sp. NPDC058040]